MVSAGVWRPQIGVNVSSVTVLVYEAPLRRRFVSYMSLSVISASKVVFICVYTFLGIVALNVFCIVYSCSCELRSKCVLYCVCGCFGDDHVCIGAPSPFDWC